MFVLRREDLKYLDSLVDWLYDVDDSESDCMVLYDWSAQMLNIVIGDFIVVPEGGRELSREHALGTLNDVLLYVVDHFWFCFEYDDLVQDFFAAFEEEESE